MHGGARDGDDAVSRFRPADHAMGLELQLEELTEQRQRAVVQGREEEAARLQREIEAVVGELALTAEAVADARQDGMPGA